MSRQPTIGRRTLMMAAPAMLAASGAAAQAPPAVETPKLELAFTIYVQIGPTQEIGAVPAGVARVIPITGGVLEGKVRGRVIPGGADWQISRPDGVTELRAHYGLETTDGAVIQVNNHCLITPHNGARLIRSRISMEAPTGPHDWLNKYVFLGTLNAPGDARAPVVIRGFQTV